MMIKLEAVRVTYPKGKPHKVELLGHSWISDLKRESMGLGWDDLGQVVARRFPGATWFRAFKWKPANRIDGGLHWVIGGTI